MEHWKGVIHGGDRAASLAASLAGSRLVACAQVSEDGTLAVKTVRGAVERVVQRVRREAKADGVPTPPMAWVPIVGNDAYLKWVAEETKVDDQDEEEGKAEL